MTPGARRAAAEGADARGFLDAQGLSWMHDLAAAEERRAWSSASRSPRSRRPVAATTG